MDPSSPPAPSDPSGPSLVVGLGASAGGVEALEAFFGGLPEADGMVFVVVLHLPPDQESQLAEVLAAQTAMPVERVVEAVRAEPGRVYVVPPGQTVAVEDGVLRPSPAQDERHRLRPVDHLFRTLAEAWGERAVAVVLSGTGSNGTVGAGLVKERGGLVLAQDPTDALYGEMPRSAVADGAADRALPAADLGARLVAHLDHLRRTGGLDDEGALDGDGVKALRGVLAHLRTRAGHDFAHYKRSTVLRRLARRLHVTGADTLDAYLAHLRADPDEPAALLDDLLISVTQFFRDREAFGVLERDVVPGLFEGKAPHDEVRVWAAGCATGEEAYALAMLLDEHAAGLDEPPAFQVFATDLSARAVQTARAGLYPASIEADVSPERLRRYFTEEAGAYRVRQDLRERVLFAPHSLLRDPPFSRLDLVSCRNLLIYLQRDLQRRVLELFHYALAPGGVLFLGSAESTDGAAGLYETLDKSARLYRRRETDGPPPRLPSRQGRRVPPPPGDRPEPEPERPDPAALLDRLQAEAAPPGLLLDEHHDVVRLTDSAAPYLRVAGGAPTPNALRMVRPELQGALQTALFGVGRDEGPVEVGPVSVEVEGEARRVRLRARAAPGGLVHVGIEAAPTAPGDAPPSDGGADDGGAGQALRDELQETRANLQLVVEEYETSREELQAQNEELQSINEELRSTGEELETSKEEAQSVAEELQTVNDELKAKVDEVTRAKSDLENLMVSTEIATLFLDRRLRIQRFTPRVREHFHVLSSDVGRPLDDLAHRFRGAALTEDAEAVLETLAVREREVQDADGRWYLVHVRPYRTVDDRIDGVVVTFVDVTERKRAEEETQRARVYAEQIVDSVPEPLLVLTPDLRVQTASEAFLAHFRVRREDTEGRMVYDLGNGQWDIPALRRLLEEVLPDDDRFDDYEVEHVFEGLGRRAMRLSGRRLDGAQLILLAIRDVTEHEAAAAALRESEARFRTLAETVPDVVFAAAPDGTVDYVNRQFAALTGGDPGLVLGTTMWPDLVHPDDREAVEAAWAEARERHERFEARYRLRSGGGEPCWVIVRARPVFDEDGTLARWFGTVTDVDALARAEAEVRDLNRTLESRVEARTREVREMAARLTTAEQAERERIAQVLHDDLQQQLVGLSMTLDLLRRPAGGGAGDDEAARLHDQAGKILADSIGIARTLASELSPAVLESPRVEDLLVWLALRKGELHGLDVTVEVEEPCTVESRALRVVLHQGVQEALLNVVKHAGTTRATVRAWTEGGLATVQVSDEGSGFDARRQRAGAGGFGLPHVRERVGQAGGSFALDTAPGEGTRVTVAVPSAAPEDEA